MLQNKEKGFLMFERAVPDNMPVEQRTKNFEEFAGTFSPEKNEQQALRCMNCGVPFCHSGCPLGNLIPDFNDAVKEEKWRLAIDILHSTNNFPEFTGRVCPAPCEAACVLGINEPAVAIEYIEKTIVETAWQRGWIGPKPPAVRTDKAVAIIGSGPSGLAAAQQLNRADHRVTVFERDAEPGGLLMYGIPSFKLSKKVLNRRLDQMRGEGVEFRCDAWVGKDVPTSELEIFDAVLLTTGSTDARDLGIPGRELRGIHFATDFLSQQAKRGLEQEIAEEEILATDKNVVVIGGGDTGSDCVGTSIRHGAKRIWNIELIPRPPLERDDTMMWPLWPAILRTSTSHGEGGQRDWAIMTKEFVGDDEGNVKQIKAVRLAWSEPDASGRRGMEEIEGSEFELDCDLALLALGFLYPEQDTVIKDLGLELDERGNIKTDARFQTSKEGVFAAGDARRGQSLVVWAIHEGREAAHCMDLALMGHSDLPRADSQGYENIEV